MHAKYELMLQAVYNNHFNILYFAWLDIGLYRKLIDKEEGLNETFEIYIPPDMDQNKVAYNKVFNRSEDMTLENIMLTNQVWVCGCYFVARASVMLRWVAQYMKHVEYFLCQDIMNTDQQVLYGIFNAGQPDI